MGKEAVPKTHQPALSNGSQGLHGVSDELCVVRGVRSYLQLRKMLGSLLDVHPPQADANGARRDDDDLVAILPQLHGRLYYRCQDGEEGLMALFVHN